MRDVKRYGTEEKKIKIRMFYFYNINEVIRHKLIKKIQLFNSN